MRNDTTTVMRLKRVGREELKTWDPYALSDDQIETLYSMAKQQLVEVEDFPTNSTGRMVTASSFLSLLHRSWAMPRKLFSNRET